MSTLEIDNFRGAMTSFLYGDVNSGRSYAQSSSGQNPFVKPGQLTWSEKPTQIDPTGSVITDLILAMKERVESNTVFVYAIGHTGRLYKIQVNDPTTFNPNYDNPVLLATLSINSPTFTRGGYIDFFGTTEKIYIGHDMGVTNINFDGTGETFVGTLGSWTQNIPRPLKQFVGNLYASNGSNLTEIIQAGTVSTYTKLAPSFPTNTQVRDIDVSPDGTYLETVVTRLALFDITSPVQDTTSTSNSESYIFKWNGTDTGYTAFSSFPSYALGANIMFQNYQYTFGTDQYGSAIYAPYEKVQWIAESPCPLPNAITSTGNILAWMAPLYFNGVLEADLFFWGSLDFEVGHPLGWWDTMFINATSPETDIIRVPCLTPVSNTGFGSSSNNYTNNLFGSSKMYFSTLETSAAPTTVYRLYKWTTTASLTIPQGVAVSNALYQTQSQMFSQKITVSAVRIYSEPWANGVSFQVDLIGSGNTPIVGATQIFSTQNTDPTAPMFLGTDYAWWGPDTAPTYCLGVSITNLGETNFTINKIEIDYEQAGK